MKEYPKVHVGMTLYARVHKDVYRSTSHAFDADLKVSKIGTKYFYTEDMRFHKNNWKFDSDTYRWGFGVSVELFTSAEQRTDHVEQKRWKARFEKIFREFYQEEIKPSEITISQYRQMAEVLGIELENNHG